MTTELLEIAAEAPLEQFTPLELEAITQKLDTTIQSKLDSGELRFSSPKGDVDPNSSTLDISRFGSLGLQGPDDLRQFLLTEAGETVIHEIAKEVTLERAQEEERQFEIQQQILEEERIKALLFHLLLDEEEEAKKIQEELIAEQQEHVLNKDEHHAPQSSPQPKKESDTLLKAYNDSIDKCTKEQRALGERIAKLEKERELLEEKHDAYEKSFNEFDEEAHEFENGTKDIDEEIGNLKQEMDEIAKTMSVTGDEKEMRRLGNKLNTKDFKISNLENIRAVLKGEKRFADADGNFEKDGKPIAFKDAAFVLSHDQEIKKDEITGKYCLLEKGQTLEKMTDQEKEIAQKNYEHSKKDLQLVKHTAKDIKKEELHSNAMQLAKHKAEHRMLQNHINRMHAARANAQMALQKNPRLGVPQSSMTPKSTLSISSPSTAPSVPKPSVQEVFGNFVQNTPKPMTWGMLFKFVEEIPNPKAKNEANKVLTKEGKKEVEENPKYAKQKDRLEDILKHPEKFKTWLTNTLSAAPVPDATMQNILKNMARYSQDPYDPDTSIEKSPLQLEKEPQQQPSPMSSKL
ncbi:coiled coil protein [Legionella gratiana]|uniref:Coiled coil protein n=1 Tax=Legionella gratiana TaxID=45066 RepID=A0A378JAY4_9GAMM|nr:hypothetical protein [Legionella gratiana]KTD11093.1 coiled coil protein [Legionella gratiana]STX44516.1 coiled coil protein [Legionella gratiana]